MDPQRRPAWSPFFTTECAVVAHSRPTLYCYLACSDAPTSCAPQFSPLPDRPHMGCCHPVLLCCEPPSPTRRDVAGAQRNATVPSQWPAVCLSSSSRAQSSMWSCRTLSWLRQTVCSHRLASCRFALSLSVLHLNLSVTRRHEFRFLCA